MRLHPAVATALVLVGGVLLALPVYDWLHHAPAVHSANGAVPSSPIPVSLLSIALGLVFVFVGVVFSFESRSSSDDRS